MEVHGDGQRDMMALREHYSGEGNASRRIATTERMRESLHYKSERSLAFSVSLDRMQRMFNIYEEEKEEFSENANIRELFKWVQHPQLPDTVKALKVRFDMEGLTYTQAANHLTAAVSELPEFHTTRRVAAACIMVDLLILVPTTNTTIPPEKGPQNPASVQRMGKYSRGLTSTGGP